MTERLDSSPPSEVHLYHSFVPADLHGATLRDYLQHRWPEVDRVFLRQLAAAGRVDVNGEAAELRQRLRADDVIEVRSPVPTRQMPRHEGAQAPAPCLLHEDQEVLLVDKPPGLPSEPDRGGKYPGARGLLEVERPGQWLRVVHRLATDASGCLLLAKAPDIVGRLVDGLAAGVMRIEYLALVSGVLQDAEIQVARALGPDPRRPGRVRVVPDDSKGARAARTGLRLEEAFRTHCLVRAVPDSIRGHQVRVHLRDIGHPVVADREYGRRPELLLSEIKQGYKSRRGAVERPLLDRMFLHVERVTWSGPEPGQPPRTVVAPLPKDLAMVLAKLRSFAAPHAR